MTRSPASPSQRPSGAGPARPEPGGGPEFTGLPLPVALEVQAVAETGPWHCTGSASAGVSSSVRVSVPVTVPVTGTMPVTRLSGGHGASDDRGAADLARDNKTRNYRYCTRTGVACWPLQYRYRLQVPVNVVLPVVVESGRRRITGVLLSRFSAVHTGSCNAGLTRRLKSGTPKPLEPLIKH